MIASADMTELVIQLIFMVVFGFICAAVAAGRGRSAVGWFFVGFFFSCLGLILLLVLPDPRKEEARFLRQAQENRRLREQLKKERQVSDQRHHGVERRLGAHDQALGMDTSAATQIGAGEAAPAELPPPLPDGASWYFAKGGQRQGPTSVGEVRRLLRAGEIDDDTLVWRQGMADWQPARDVPELGGDRGTA